MPLPITYFLLPPNRPTALPTTYFAGQMTKPNKPFGLRELAGLAGLAVLVFYLARALLHLRDLSGIHHLAGVWMALASYYNQGIFYPPLEADGFYAGTRYMPLLFVLIAGLSRVVGDYLVAAKLAALLSTTLLLSGVFVAVRRATGRLADAFAMTALVLAFPEGTSALLSPHADALPVGLALWGLLLIDREKVRPWQVILVALLFALALSAKFSAVAGPAAAAVVVGRRGHPWLAVLGAVLFAGFAGLEVVAFQWASDGRFLENLRSLGSGGASFAFIRIGPARLIFAMVQLTPFLLIWPLAILLLGVHRRQAMTSVWSWYLLSSLAVTVVIFTSPGTGYNHLLEFQVACVLVLAGLVPSLASSPDEEKTVLLLRACALFGLVVGLWRLAGPADPAAIAPLALARALPKDEQLLCEDASVPVLLGRRPVVMDPFAFRVLAERGLIDDEPLAERVSKQEFAALVTIWRIDQPSESLCPHLHFGPRVTKAMLRAYRFDRHVGRYCVFRPYPTALASANR
jgi:hypothetical protein